MREYPPALNTVFRVERSQNMREPLYGVTSSALAENVTDKRNKAINIVLSIMFTFIYI